MEIYQEVIDYLWEFPIFQSWPEIQELLKKAAAHRPRHWLLPQKVCLAVGGTMDQSLPAVAAVACLQLSILLVDDMLDEDPRGEYHQAGMAKTANYALALQSLGEQAIISSNIPARIKLNVLDHLNQMMQDVAIGQHIDVQVPADENTYWQVVDKKSASFFGSLFFLGSYVGKADRKTAAALEQFGRLYGELIQIHDDLNDTMAVPAGPDWVQGRTPLPILFVQVVDHPDRERFMELRQEITNEAALHEAQDILIRCGAVSYCVDQLLGRYQSANTVLQSIPLVKTDGFLELLEETIAPVKRLFKAMGKTLQV